MRKRDKSSSDIYYQWFTNGHPASLEWYAPCVKGVALWVYQDKIGQTICSVRNIAKVVSR